MPSSAPLARAVDARPARGVATRAPWLHGDHALAYAAIALALVVRVVHVLAADFPLNDGGLFYLMTREIQAAGYRLPAFTAYNDAAIPFAYPPAALYLAAAANDATGVPLLQLFRVLPLVCTSLFVVAFYRLASALILDARVVAAATVALAVMPRSFSWLLMGGGLTRSLGLLAATVALHQAYLLYTRREWRFAVTTAVACALTVLSHIGTATFLAFSIALFFVFYGRHWRGVLSSAAVVVATLALTAPWWGTVMAEHGAAPFLAARGTSGTAFSDLESRYAALVRLAQFNLFATGEPLFPLVGFLAVLGSLTALRPGRFILPVWWVLITLLDTRAGPTYAAIPAAMLAGYGVVDVLLPTLRSLYAAPPRPVRGTTREPLPPLVLRHVPALVLGFFLAFGTASALSRSPDYGTGDGPDLASLTPADRGAMRWVAARTPDSSRFLVVTGRPWFTDRVAEWFPTLTGRRSVSTVQGLEWRPAFTTRVQENLRLQTGCRTADGRCLATWADDVGRPFTHVYVWKATPVACCTALIAALKTDPGYSVVYDGPGALIAERR